MSSRNTEKIQEILMFWFEEVTSKQKFTKDLEFDALVSEKFKDSYWEIVRDETKGWRETPEGRLAEIIVLDQFARNMFRDDKQSFAGDELALELAQEALEAGDDKKVSQERRMFFYKPYMHSESKEVHTEALKIFTEHGDEGNLKYEIKHKSIIDQFGRYPHRNELLGRESTSEELEFLKTNTGF
ncbi:MAG: DUF924 domain-containing protein [Candidatus Pacebacteria bacterium]|nr:DUF924 domain-containing protein [Candidatus Paceibacterota bacterium]